MPGKESKESSIWSTSHHLQAAAEASAEISVAIKVQNIIALLLGDLYCLVCKRRHHLRQGCSTTMDSRHPMPESSELRWL